MKLLLFTLVNFLIGFCTLVLSSVVGSKICESLCVIEERDGSISAGSIHPLLLMSVSIGFGAVLTIFVLKKYSSMRKYLDVKVLTKDLFVLVFLCCLSIFLLKLF